MSSPAPSHRARPSSASLVTVPAISVLLVLLVLAGSALLRGRDAGLPPTEAAPRLVPMDDRGDVRARRDVVRAARVLRAWDAARGAAYASGDVPALGRLYAPGSEAGRADRRILQAYAARGLVVRGMRMQVLDLRVLDRTREGLRLLVTDRLHRAVAVTAAGARTRLPCDLPSTRVLTLVRATDGRVREGRGLRETPWQVSAVRLRSGP